MRARPFVPILVLVALTASSTFAQTSRPDLGDSKKEEPKLMVLKGAIRKVLPRDAEAETPEPVFLMKSRKKTWEVTLDPRGRVYEHRATPLGEVKEGSQLFVLGRYQESTRIPESSHSLPPQIVQIVTLVAAEHFRPPALDPKIKKTKVKWFQGRLQRQGKGFILGGVNMQAGPERVVLVVKERPRDKPYMKNKRISVTGTLVAKARPMKFSASQICLLDPRFPPVQYRQIIREGPRAKVTTQIR